MATRRGSEESQAHAPVAALRPPRVIQTSRRRSDALVIEGSRPTAKVARELASTKHAGQIGSTSTGRTTRSRQPGLLNEPDHAPLTAGMTGFAGIMLIITGVLRLLIIALDLLVIWTLIASRHDSSLS